MSILLFKLINTAVFSEKIKEPSKEKFADIIIAE